MNILLTLDGKTFAEQAIPQAQRLAVMPGTEVHLLAVIDPRVQQTLSPDVELALDRYLADVARMFPLNLVCAAIRVGPHPADQIAAYAEANHIDIIVMATHGHSPLHDDNLDSVAQQVVNAGVAPVTLVRSALVA